MRLSELGYTDVSDSMAEMKIRATHRKFNFPYLYDGETQKVSEAFGELDGLFLWTDANRVVVTWRARFHYAFRPEEIRRATLSFVQ